MKYSTDNENICEFAFGDNVVYLRASLYFSECYFCSVFNDTFLWRLDEFSYYDDLVKDSHVNEV